MRTIFIGFLFILLDFNLNLGSSSIELIPDFIGYIYVLKGLMELSEHSEWFTRLKPFANGMAIFSGIIFVMDLLGISVAMGTIVTMPLAIVSTIISLYITYGIVMGIKDMEAANEWDLNSDSLYSTWKVLVICTIVSYMVFFIPFVAIIGIVVGVIANIFFLYSFNHSKNRYISLC